MNNILLASDAIYKLSLGGITFLIGLVMVFLVLGILIGLVELIHAILAKTSNKSKKNVVPEKIEAAPQITSVASNDEEVVAAITAAINMYYEVQSASTGKSVKFRVRSIKEIR